MRASTIVAVLLLVSACAMPAAPPAVPAAPKYPDFLFPAVPPALRGAREAARIDEGWRYLQSDRLGAAEREFAAALKSNRAFYPAHAGEAYVSMARKNYDRAVAAFDAALAGNATYVPALVGKGDALLALKRDDQALASFETALAADPSLTDLQRRVELLRFRTVQETLTRARADATAGRLVQARDEYQRALAASPDSGLIYRELGGVEQRLGDTGAALMHLRRASELDPADAEALVELGELLDQQRDVAGALDAFRKAAALQPGADLSARIAADAERVRDAGLPAEYRAVAGEAQVTRGELAALIGVRLEALLRGAPQQQVVITDVAGHWAARWIADVVRAGVMEPFANHTFQPRARVSRADLAAAVSRVLRLEAARNPGLAARLARRPAIADLPPTHLSYPAAADAVAAGVMPLAAGQRFQSTRAVTGAEAIDAIERLRTILPAQR